MLNVEVKNLTEVKRYLAQLPERTFKDAKKAFSEAVFKADKKIKDNATDKLRVRTGALRRSIVSVVSGSDLDTLQASVGSASKVGGLELVYAPIHEFGGTVRAKKAYKRVLGGPYLNIPLSSNKTAAGVTRLQAREVFNQGGRVIKTKNGKYGVLLNGQMMFILKKQVVIPARLGMIKAAEDEIPTILSRLMDLIGEDR
jgi:phage gpG-like protein